jgi:hypothetical protein
MKRLVNRSAFKAFASWLSDYAHDLERRRQKVERAEKPPRREQERAREQRRAPRKLARS